MQEHGGAVVDSKVKSIVREDVVRYGGRTEHELQYDHLLGATFWNCYGLVFWAVDRVIDSGNKASKVKQVTKMLIRAMARLTTWAILALSQQAMAGEASTGYQFAVSENGSATVSVPIQVPRGIGGIEPQLSLNYSSASGNGLVGLGWVLTGPSAVTRCPKTIQHDGVRGRVTFSTADRFCMDGQRLVVVNVANTDSAYGSVGAEYRTYPDTFSRITALGPLLTAGAPSGFRVETKSGLVMEYGTDAGGQIPTNFSASLALTPVINRWMLQRIKDKNGNSAEFVYCKGTLSVDSASCITTPYLGSAPIHYIRYTDRGGPNGTSAVVFKYESRPDVDVAYTYGSSIAQAQRLSAIETYVGFTGIAVASRGTRVRKYALNYETLATASGVATRITRFSKITKIAEFGMTDADTLPPLEFTYPVDALYGNMTVALLPNASSGTVTNPDTCGGVLMGKPTKMMCP